MSQSDATVMSAGPMGAAEEKRKNSPSLLGVNSVLYLVIGLVLWWLTWPTLDPQGLTDYGIVAILSWEYWLAVAAIALGFTLSLSPRLAATPLPYAHLVGLVIVLHATPPLVYGSLRYSWAWKHIGIVDYIQRHGTVDPVAPFLAAYHNWPGLFYVSAQIANQFALKPVEIAKWVSFTPVVLNTLFILALVPIYRRLTDDPRLVAAAIWIFVVGNWIGQDYYSPQGVTYLAFLLILGLCLGPLRNSPTGEGADNGWLAWARGMALRFPEHPMPQYGIAARAAFFVAFAALVLATVATHQLTPISIIFLLAALFVMGRVSIYLVIFAILAEVLWVLSFAAPFVVFHLSDELNNIGEGINAAQQKLVDISVVSPGRVWVIIIGRVLTAGIGLLAVLGGLRRLWLGHRDGLAVAILGSTFLLLVNRYGGEILFRVYLFSLPMLAFFAAGLFYPTLRHGRNLLWRGLFLAFSLFGIVGFLFANNGKDRQYYFTPEEVEASLWLYGHAPPNSLLIEGSRNYPSQFMNYENFAYVPMSEEKKPVRDEMIAAPDEIFARWLSDPKWSAA